MVARLKFLQGKKTGIVLAMAVLTGILQGLGILDKGLAEPIYTGLGFATVGTVAARISRNAKINLAKTGVGLLVLLVMGCAQFGARVCNETDVADKRIELMKMGCVPAAEAVPGDVVVGTKVCVKVVDILMAGLDLGCILSPRETAPVDEMPE